MRTQYIQLNHCHNALLVWVTDVIIASGLSYYQDGQTDFTAVVDLLFRVIGDKQSRASVNYLFPLSLSQLSFCLSHCAYLQTIATPVFNLGVQPP